MQLQVLVMMIVAVMIIVAMNLVPMLLEQMCYLKVIEMVVAVMVGMIEVVSRRTVATFVTLVIEMVTMIHDLVSLELLFTNYFFELI